MKRLIKYSILILVLLVGQSSLTHAECSDNPRDCFKGFNGDTIVTNSGKAERTFSVPPMKAGFLVDFSDLDVLPFVSIELLSVGLPVVDDVTLDLGVATSRVFIDVVFEFIPIVKIGPSIWIGYNVPNSDISYGVGVSFLDF